MPRFATCADCKFSIVYTIGKSKCTVNAEKGKPGFPLELVETTYNEASDCASFEPRKATEVHVCCNCRYSVDNCNHLCSFFNPPLEINGKAALSECWLREDAEPATGVAHPYEAKGKVDLTPLPSGAVVYTTIGGTICNPEALKKVEFT